ncbi:SRP40, C-terminal domain-containing protein, partial [Epithele typhae]|uniref:SRP40, C-terminal domain-containing protein n=1 Tax=Epithele typhae TaxID=378194 RepID=UPI0020073F41
KSNGGGKKANGGKNPRKPNTPFQRIKVDQIAYSDERLMNNAFESRGAAVDDYGARASRDLIVTRGAAFRKEKNKKKRGSYKGGSITV